MYSDSAITKEQVSEQLDAKVGAIDAKQTEQIKKLRIWLMVVTVVAAVNAVTLAVLISPFF